MKTTGTTDERAARKVAEAYYDTLRDAVRHVGEMPNLSAARRFDRVAEQYLANRKTDAGDDARRLRACKDDDHTYLARNGLAAFFGKNDVGSITTDRIRQFLSFTVATSTKGKLAPSTQKRTLVVLRAILKSAFERGLIFSIPLFPKIKLKDQPRAAFSRSEYRRLYRMAWVMARAARERGDRIGFDLWMEMADFVILMVSTYLRSSEWAAIRQRHVTIVDGPQPYLRIAAVRGKTGEREVYSQPEAVAAYRRIMRRNGTDAEAFLFKVKSLNRTTASERMRDDFERLLHATGLKHNAFGKPRVIHSLRHSAITFGVINGVSHLLLAKNAGTGVDQIERFYASGLEVGMMLDNLHQRS